MSLDNNNLSEEQSLHNIYLSALRRNKTRVAIHLQKGIKLCGEIEGYDAHIIALKDHEKTQIVFKHAISTIVPDDIYG
ncbi:MAG: RNA chaperone Hfq [Gammaproteobacteria bacterium]|nr:RNA chaperone Hfq [Gammaproteobacteria bacterium]